MKLLWLCNLMPDAIREVVYGQTGGGALWVDHVLSDLRRQDIAIRVLCPSDVISRGWVDDKCSYATFQTGVPHEYCPQQEDFFEKELEDYYPDVIHVWGTEYGHTLAMMRAAEKRWLLDHLVVSIQGLCSVYTAHYAEGVPYAVQRGATFRDLVRQDNILQQQEKFRLRGENEVAALKLARHVIGRTDWDRACTSACHPSAVYHFCNETLREPFYEGQWRFEDCKKHRIFASSCAYPVKGFHYLLEAFREVLRDYPDATLAVPGNSFLTAPKLRRTRYQKYLAELAKTYGLEEKIEFLGNLSAEGMKAEFLEANVFALPSTIENSPNSLGEAMLLGVPCVSSDVGGVRNLLEHGAEGYLYQSTAPYMLAYHIKAVFAMKDRAETLGAAARNHAARTHDPETNLQALLAIYRSIQS